MMAWFQFFVLVATPSLVLGDDLGNTTTPDTGPSAPLSPPAPTSETGPEPGPPTTPPPSPPTTEDNGTLGDLRPVTDSAPVRNHTDESPRRTPSTVGPAPATPGNPTGAHSTRRPTGAPPCPTPSPHAHRGVAGRCLIAICVLASVATACVASTVVLATRLSAARRRLRAGLLGDTEMICISDMVSDSDHPMSLSRHPKSNGALIPAPGDEGDDLTLNSFLPETESAP